MNQDPEDTKRAQAAELAGLHKEIEHLKHNVVCIPEGFPGAEAIRKNIAEFMKRGATKVAHLIMIIHEPQKHS